jgi:hypothetical protein
VAAMVRADAGIDRRLVQLASDPLGIRALEFFAERTASRKDVAEALGVSLESAGGLIEKLSKLGLIELADRRGEDDGVAEFYRALAVPFWSNEDMRELSLQERIQLAAWIAEVIYADVQEGLEAETFNARPDTHASRTRFVVDEQGWRELNRIQDDALDASFSVQAASAERLAENGGEEIHVMGAMLTVEMPAPKPPA